MSTDRPLPPREAAPLRVLRIRDGRTEAVDDRVAGEEPLAIRVAGPGQDPVDVAITMRTPGDEEDLALGLLLTEGLVAAADEVVAIESGDPAVLAQPDNELVVRLGRPFDASAVAARTFPATASCGICGKASLDGVAVRCAPIPAGPVVPVATILALPGRMRRAQAAFEATGGLHAAGLFDADGRLLLLREDVGRHNALDKLIGAAARTGGLPLHDRLVLVSGRASFELVQKAAVAGVPVLAAVSAPSDLAVATAERLGVTLVGFVREGSCNVYARPDRIATGPA